DVAAAVIGIAGDIAERIRRRFQTIERVIVERLRKDDLAGGRVGSRVADYLAHIAPDEIFVCIIVILGSVACCIDEGEWLPLDSVLESHPPPEGIYATRETSSSLVEVLDREEAARSGRSKTIGVKIGHRNRRIERI